jgi:hypothetical protein
MDSGVLGSRMMPNNPDGTNKARRLLGPDVIYPELSYRIMKAVFEVHNQLGPGFSEEIYQNALVSELASYLKATGLRLGILINFGIRRVEYVRIAN